MVINRILFLFLVLPFFSFGQRTFIPDDAFEQALINLDLDDFLDDSVNTFAIDSVQILDVSNEDIVDLTGIQDFVALTTLFCYNNQLYSLDLSNNPNLFEVSCGENQLTSLSVKNGNPTGLWYFTAINNPDLACVEVDNVAYANYNWLIDNTAVFSTNCNISSIYELNTNRKLIKIIDVFGSEVVNKNNQYLIYLYDDGTIQKEITIK